jgi:ABC-type nitrate/sulfonate/bicarbonate transport system substrate-binding protein
MKLFKLSGAVFSLALLATPIVAAEPVSISLDWMPNTNHIGIFVAKAKGFYEDRGLDVTIKPFSRTDRDAEFRTSSALGLFTRRAAGEDAIGVMATIQRETGRLIYLGDREDIESPRDLEGLVYGGFGSVWEEALLITMIAHDGGDPQYETAVLDTEVYDALDAGEVDFTLDILTWEGVRKELEGVEIGAFAYADYGVPDQHTFVLSTEESFAEANPETVQAFVAATQQGVAYALENPGEASEILIAASSELESEAELVRASLALMIEGHYLTTPDGAIGVFDDTKMVGLGEFLFEAGALIGADGTALAERPDFAGYYTNRYLD